MSVTRSSSSHTIFMLRLNWSYLVNTAITGTGKPPRVNPSSYSCVLTYHSYPGKYCRNTSSLVMAGHYPLGCNTWKKKSCNIATVVEKKQTISRATDLLIAPRATFAERILARSSAHPHYQPRIRGSRGKYNHHVFRKWVRHRCHGSLAVITIVTVTITHRH